MAWEESAVQWAVTIGSWAMLLLGVVVIGGAIIAIAWYREQQKQYGKYKVIVWEQYKNKMGNEIPVFVDISEKGKIFFDKKLKRYFFHLKNANCHLGEKEGKEKQSELDISHVPYQKGGEVVFVQKLDHKKYAIGEPMVVDGKIEVKVTQADLAESTRSYDLNLKTYGKKPNEIWAFALYIGLAVIAMVLVYIVFQKVDVLQKVVEASNEQTRMMMEITKVLKGGAVSSTVPG